MENIKHKLSKLPAIYLTIITILYWLDTSTLFNPIAILLFLLLSLYLIFDNKYFGFSASSLIIIINLYLIFALTSEYREFNNYKEGLTMLYTGLILIIINISASIFIFISTFNKSIL